MAEEQNDDLRDTLKQFIRIASSTNDIENDIIYRRKLSAQAIITDVTGSLGCWGITHL